ncbi:MAG: hypothetical protein N2442_13890 [Spirochaetes bacterium]|nr:hypothetical protein [Spirochaetota bacterium]
MKRFLLVFCLIFLLGDLARAEGSRPTDPVPYAPEEFPSWARALRRGEIVALGLFPFVFLFSSLAYDTFRFAASGGNPNYAPGPFQSPGASPVSQHERMGVLVVSISVSALLAFLDFVIESKKPIDRRSHGNSSDTN